MPAEGAAMPSVAKKGLDANTIKLIAILAMTADHIAWAVFPGAFGGEAVRQGL